MSKTDSADFSCKKAFELGYALFRLSATAKSRSFAEMLENKATALLDAALSEDYGSAKAALKHIEYFMRLGADAGLIHPRNAEIIIKEGNGLYTAIAGLPESAKLQGTKLQDLNLDKIFSKSLLQVQNAIPATAKRARIPAKQELQDGREIAETELQESDEAEPAKSSIRQSAILEKLQQFGNLPNGNSICRFGELQKLLPETSERTLRYDLQVLIDKGVIEKIGGKRGFYRLKSPSGPAIALPGVSSIQS